MYAVINLSQHQWPNVQVSHSQPHDSKKKKDQTKDGAKGFCATKRAGKAEVERKNSRYKVNQIVCGIAWAYVCSNGVQHMSESEYPNQQQHHAQNLSNGFCHDYTFISSVKC